MDQRLCFVSFAVYLAHAPFHHSGGLAVIILDMLSVHTTKCLLSLDAGGGLALCILVICKTKCVSLLYEYVLYTMTLCVVSVWQGAISQAVNNAVEVLHKCTQNNNTQCDNTCKVSVVTQSIKKRTPKPGIEPGSPR